MFLKLKKQRNQISDHPLYKKALQFQYGMNGNKQDYHKAYEYYQQAASDGDKSSQLMIEATLVPRRFVFIFVLNVILSLVIGFVFNEFWILFFLPGIQISYFTTLTFNTYWYKPGWVYKVHRFMFFFSYLGLLPLSAIFPYLFGISWMPITLLFVLGIFIIGAGVILFFDEKSLNHILIIVSGLVILTSSIVGLSISTSEQKFVVREIQGGVEIVGIRTSETHLKIPDKLNNQPVIRIGEAAFRQTLIESIILPDTIQEIDDYAFAYTPNLKTIDIPVDIHLGKGVYMFATALESIPLPTEMEKIPDQLLMGTYQLQFIELPSNLKEIGRQAFAYSGIREIELTNGIEIIHDEAFKGTYFKEITLPNSVNQLGNYVFSENSQLQSIILSNQLTRIPEGTFYQTTSLIEYEIPIQITIIGDRAFKNSSLRNIRFHNNIVDLGEETFMNSHLSEVVIPENVTQLRPRIFQDSLFLTNVELPSTLTRIQDSVFRGTSLSHIYLPNDLKSIGSGAFANIKTLTTLTIPNSVETLGGALLSGNESLEVLNLPESIESIGDYFCYECASLTSIDFPNSIEKIGNYAFYNSNLQQISLPSNLLIIGDYAFFSVDNAKDIRFNDVLEDIGAYAFYGNYSIESLEFPSSLLRIGDGAFSLCLSVESITLNTPLLSYVGYYAFYQCEEATIYINKDIDTSLWNTAWNPNNISIIEIID